jgi:hypothetical protein
MGNFTLTLKAVIEMEGGNIGLDTYPIFDEAYREPLNKKIIDHFWNQEIGQETIEMWRFAMRRKMNEIMPLYNQHYVLGLLEADPLSTVSIKDLSDSTATGTSTGTSNNNSTSAAKSRAVASDTPQTQLMPDADYATSMQDNISDGAATSEATDVQDSGQTSHNEHNQTGYTGHAPMLILQARQALVNVDMMVIAELQELFMLLWATNDSYSGRQFPYYGLY